MSFYFKQTSLFYIFQVTVSWSTFQDCSKRPKRMTSKETVSAALLLLSSIINDGCSGWGMLSFQRACTHHWLGCVQVWRAGTRGWSSLTEHISVSRPGAPWGLFLSGASVCVWGDYVSLFVLRTIYVGRCVCQRCSLWGVCKSVSPLPPPQCLTSTKQLMGFRNSRGRSK